MTISGSEDRPRTGKPRCGTIPPACNRGRPGAIAGADRPATGRQRARACRQHRGHHLWPGRRRARRQWAGPVRAGAGPSGVVAAARRPLRGHRRNTRDARARDTASRRAGLATAAGEGAAPGTRGLRGGRAVPGCGVGPGWPVPVAGAVAGRAGACLAEPAVGRPGGLPARRDRGGSHCFCSAASPRPRRCWPDAWSCSPASR